MLQEIMFNSNLINIHWEYDYYKYAVTKIDNNKTAHISY